MKNYLKRFLSSVLVASVSVLLFASCSSTQPAEDEKAAPALGVQTPSAADQTVGEFFSPADIDASYLSEGEDGITYINATAPCFEISGMLHPSENGGFYYRLNYYDKELYSSDNTSLASCTAGGRIRFRTTASSFVLKVVMRGAITGMNHFANRGAYGFDIYAGTGTARTYVGDAMQFMTGTGKVETTITLPDNGGEPQEIMIDLPLYGGVNNVELGFTSSDTIAVPLDYTYQKPVVFYGSSITQGGCVSRPGNGYFHLVTRAIDANCVNLGFSGSAMGEQSVAEYIASLDMSAFVMAYDYNSPSPEHLESTHYDFYKTVRDENPDLPIILMCHPYYAEATADDLARVAVVKATYDKAVADGDTNTYFIDSETYFPAEMRDIYAVDFLHPNDLGHYRMAVTLYPVLKEALTAKK